MCSNFNRQCDRYGIHKSSGRPECGTNTNCNSSVGNSNRLWNLTSLQSYCRDRQYNSRHTKPTTGFTQLDVKPEPVLYDRYDVGSAYCRSLCNFSKRPVTDVQLQIQWYLPNTYLPNAVTSPIRSIFHQRIFFPSLS